MLRVFDAPLEWRSKHIALVTSHRQLVPWAGTSAHMRFTESTYEELWENS